MRLSPTADTRGGAVAPRTTELEEDAGVRLEDADDAEEDAVTRPRSAEGARVDAAATLMDAATAIFERSSVADCGTGEGEANDDVTRTGGVSATQNQPVLGWKVVGLTVREP